MPISTRCPACRASIKVHRTSAGSVVECPECGADVEVPGGGKTPRGRGEIIAGVATVFLSVAGLLAFIALASFWVVDYLDRSSTPASRVVTIEVVEAKVRAGALVVTLEMRNGHPRRSFEWRPSPERMFLADEFGGHYALLEGAGATLAPGTAVRVELRFATPPPHADGFRLMLNEPNTGLSGEWGLNFKRQPD